MGGNYHMLTAKTTTSRKFSPLDIPGKNVDLNLFKILE